MTLLAVVGMRMEAALLPPGTRTLVGTRLEDVGADVTAVLSFGIAGGLAPALRPGDLVVATRVRDRSGAWAGDFDWTTALARHTGARLGVVAGAGTIVADPAAKRVLRNATDALIVDLESAAAAAFAMARGVPFACLRAVADTAADTLPRAALVGMTADGRTAPGRVAWELLRRPADLPALYRAAARTRVALAALRRVAPGLPEPG